MYAPAGAPVGGRCGTFRVAGRPQMKIEGANEDRWGILTLKASVLDPPEKIEDFVDE